MIRRVASVLLVVGLLETGALGQTAPPLIARPDETPPPTPTPAATSSGDFRSFREPIPTDPAHPNYHAGAHRSIVRHNPLPRRTSYQSNYPYQGEGNSSGTNNGSHYSTGGVGRIAEYYDNRTLAPEVDHHPVPVAGFDNASGAPNRSEQIQAQQAGAQRTSNIQSNINAYGRPYGAMGAGLGYGLGLGGGGGLYTYPY